MNSRLFTDIITMSDGIFGWMLEYFIGKFNISLKYTIHNWKHLNIPVQTIKKTLPLKCQQYSNVFTIHCTRTRAWDLVLYLKNVSQTYYYLVFYYILMLSINIVTYISFDFNFNPYI